jgi:hypothetical protein
MSGILYYFNPFLITSRLAFITGAISKYLPSSPANVISAIRAVNNAFFLPAFPDGADATLADMFAIGGDAAHAVDIPGFKWVIVFLRPFLSDFFAHFIVVFLRGDVSATVRANQSAICYLFFHFTLILPSPIKGEGKLGEEGLRPS